MAFMQCLSILLVSRTAIGFAPSQSARQSIHHRHQGGTAHPQRPAPRSSSSKSLDEMGGVELQSNSRLSPTFQMRRPAMMVHRTRLYSQPRDSTDVDDFDDEDAAAADDDEGAYEEFEIGDVDDDDDDDDDSDLNVEALFEDDDDEDIDEEEYEDGEGGYEEEEGEVEEEEEYEYYEAGEDITTILDQYAPEYEEEVTPLLDDISDDPNYNAAKEAVLGEVTKRKELRARREIVPVEVSSEDDAGKVMEYMLEQLRAVERRAVGNDEEVQAAEDLLEKSLLTENDLEGIIIEGEDGLVDFDPKALAEAGTFDDDRGPEAFPSSKIAENGENLPYPPGGQFTEADLVELDDQLQAYKKTRSIFDDPNYFGDEITINELELDVDGNWDALDNETRAEMQEVIETSHTMACPDPELWLMYDSHFNVTNLILASFKHSPEAPILFTQWIPQLEVYERYEEQREKNFQWTWDDVDQADVGELKRYFNGLGYDEILTKQPGETPLITLDETPLDDEEREMLALETWYDEVYDEEDQNLLFDDEKFEPRDNVFDEDYGASSSKKTTSIEEKFIKEFELFERENAGETQEWRDQFATVKGFDIRDDTEGQAVFRGHLVIACTPSEEDVELAKKIALRFRDEFGKAVFVETRVLGHAKMEDNVFEVWLESWEIDLLHSKRQAFINPKIWTGPSDVDDTQLDYLVDKVRYLISDEAKNSFRIEDYADVKL